MNLTKGQRERLIKTLRNIDLRKKECVPPKWRWNKKSVETHVKNNFFVTDQEWREILKKAKIQQEKGA